MAHVAEYKKQVVDGLVKLMNDYPVIAVVSVESIPAPQLQKVRAQIRDKVVMVMRKKRLINIALDKVKDKRADIDKLKDSIRGLPALMFTKENPFKLAATLMKSKSKAPAKPGQIAPNDIIVEAGPTSFAPGPIIGELGSLGIKTGVENGKIAIKEKKVLVKKGDPVSEKAASLLTRLGIEPMEIGLMPEAAYDNGVIFTRDVLEVDEKEYIDKLNIAESEAFNLAFEIKYPVKDVVEMLIAKAFTEAKAVGIEFKIIDKEVIDSLLGMAENEMLSLKQEANIEVPEKAPAPAAEEKKEEAKPAPEEKKEEVKEETKAEAKEEKKEETEKEPKEEKKEQETKEKPAKEEKKEDLNQKVEEMVGKTKDFAEGNIPDAAKLVEEAGKDAKEKEIKDVQDIVKKIQRGEKV